MARRKQVNPMQRIPSGEVMLEPEDIPAGHTNHGNDYAKVAANKLANGSPKPSKATTSTPHQHGITQLVICVSGIYVSLYGICCNL